MINKGSNNGIRVDNNVIAGKGLVGIVTEVGPSWATVRSIIDDSSNVSGHGSQYFRQLRCHWRSETDR